MEKQKLLKVNNHLCSIRSFMREKSFPSFNSVDKWRSFMIRKKERFYYKLSNFKEHKFLRN